MDNMDFANIDFSITKKSKKTCSLCKSAEHTITLCPLQPCNHCKQIGHISLSCPTKREEILARKRSRKMTSEELLTLEHNTQKRVENMEQIERQREADNARAGRGNLYII